MKVSSVVTARVFPAREKVKPGSPGMPTASGRQPRRTDHPDPAPDRLMVT